MAKNDQINELLKSLKKAGYEVSRTKNNHWKVTSPGLNNIVVASTPSEGRGTLNVCSELRKAGYKFTFKGKQY